MKSALQKRFVFIAKSMLWSVLLYAVLMLAFNWDDVSNKVRGSNPITVMSNSGQAETPCTSKPIVVPTSISEKTNVVDHVITVLDYLHRIVYVASRSGLM